MSANLVNVGVQVVAGVVALSKGDKIAALGHLCRANMLLGMLAGNSDEKELIEASYLVSELQLALGEAIQPMGVSWDEQCYQGADDRLDAERTKQ